MMINCLTTQIAKISEFRGYKIYAVLDNGQNTVNVNCQCPKESVFSRDVFPNSTNPLPPVEKSVAKINFDNDDDFLAVARIL